MPSRFFLYGHIFYAGVARSLEFSIRAHGIGSFFLMPTNYASFEKSADGGFVAQSHH